MKKEKEIEVVTFMIELYCHKKHKTKMHELCPECQELLDYVKYRRDLCPFGENKTFCSNCRVHCYKPDMREKIRTVMRFSGPRMMLYHPIIALKHVTQTLKEKKKLKKEEALKAKKKQEQETLKASNEMKGE